MDEKLFIVLIFKVSQYNIFLRYIHYNFSINLQIITEDSGENLKWVFFLSTV